MDFNVERLFISGEVGIPDDARSSRGLKSGYGFSEVGGATLHQVRSDQCEIDHLAALRAFRAHSSKPAGLAAIISPCTSIAMSAI